MFGGLQLKGATASKDADGEPDPAPESAVPAASGLSSFGFMNVDTPEPAAPAPAASSFSFLNPSAPESATTTLPTTASSVPVISGFSFMTQQTTTTATEPAAENTAAAPTSGFDFMNSVSTPAVSDAANLVPVAEETIIPTISEEDPAPSMPPTTGGFWSLSDNPPATTVDSCLPLAPEKSTMPTTVHTRTNSVSSVSSGLSTPSLAPALAAPNSIASNNGGLVAGAGVTFGTSSAKPRIKKKKNRASKVGVGANHSDMSAAVNTSTPAPTDPAPTTASDENKSSRNAVLQATDRAEAFMQAKTMEDVKSSTAMMSATSEDSVPDAALKTDSTANFDIHPTESTDEVLAAAQEAAEKAKILQYQQKGKGGGFMGTFFKGFRGSPNTSSVNSSGPIGSSSKHSVGSQSVGSNSSGNAVDRISKEHQAMKQAMTQRQLQQQQDFQQEKEPTLSKSEDDEGVEVSASVDNYKPASVNPLESNSSIANDNAITYTTTSDVSSFVPASIPTPSTQKSSFSFLQVPSYEAPQPSVQTSVLENVKTNNTPKEKFENHRKYFSESVNRAMKKVEDTRNLKKGLLEERGLGLAKERFAIRVIEEQEELQQAAIDEEDYELADELGQKIDAHKREKSEVANMLMNNTIALEKLESENTSLAELIVSCFEDLALRLDYLKKKEITIEKKDDTATLTQYGSISKQLSAEHERLQQDLKHLERDEELVAEERKELEHSIKDQTGEIELEKDEASSKLKEVEKEIEDLRNTLKMKQDEAADLRTKMFGFEDSISKVRVKFSRQLNRVDKKEVSVKESRREWGVENEIHKQQKDAHDLQVKTHSETLIAHEDLMKTLDSELKLSKEFCEIIPTQLGFMEETEVEDSEDEGSLALLKANVVKCEGAFDTAKKTLKMASSTIQNFENECDILVASIPELERQKKASAGERDFKSAGKFSKKIKDASVRIKECEEELNGDAKTKKKLAEDNLRLMDSELLEAKKVADAREKLSGEKRMEILAEKIAQLVKEKSEKCGESKSEGNSVKSVTARVLEGQIMVLKAEGHEIGNKHGGWDELMKGLGLVRVRVDSTTIVEVLGQNANSLSVEKTGEEDEKETNDGVITNDERLTKAKELLEKCSELESKIQEAADREAFEVAGDLQETLDKINVEIEEMRITDEECELLAAIDTGLATVSSKEEEETQQGPTNEESLLKAKELMIKQSDLKKKVDEGAENEDFETADESQTELDQVSAELMGLNSTDEERKVFDTEGTSSDSHLPELDDIKETRPGVEEEEKKDSDEENASNFEEDNPENGQDLTTGMDGTND